MPAQPRRRLQLGFTLFSLFSLLPSASATLTADPIPYVTYGPGIVNLGGWYGLLAAYSNASAVPYASSASTSYVPWNSSAPSIAVGLSLSLGQQSALDGIEPSLQFIVDLINFRGGVSVGGEAHYLSLTFALDDASDALTQLIYQDMAASGLYAAYLSPYGDAVTQALQPFLSSSQVLMMSPGNSDPADFLPGDNLFSPLNTADMTWKDLLTAVNSQAALQAAAEGDGSVEGIESLCMYSSDAVLVQAAAQGVRDWVAAENARRTVSLITVHADVSWSMNVTGTFLDYSSIMSGSCPDGVDVMVVQDGSETDLNVALALAASQLKPKAAMGLNYQNAVVLAAASGVPVAAAVPLAGWLLTYPVNFPPATTLPRKGGKLGGSYDAGYAQYFYNLGANVTGSTPNLAYVYWTALDTVQAAITQAASLNASDLRAGMLALDGEVGVLGLLNFSRSSGVNVAALSLLRQVNASGAVSNLQTGSFELVYPYPWPWPALIEPGGQLRSSQSNALALVAAVVCVLGAWVGQIITEQSVFVRRKGGFWQAWLFVVALALGGVSIWCSQLFMASALSLSKGTGSTLSLSFSAEVAMLAWLPSVLLTWCGLMVLMSDLPDSAVMDVSRSSAMRRQLNQQKEEKKKLAALSASAHLFHLLHAISWRAVLGGLMVAAAVVLSRATLWYVWMQDASWSSAGWAWAVTSVLDAGCTPLALLMFFHALRGRIFAVFLFAALVTADWQLQLAGMTFYYEPGVELLPASLRTASLSLDVLDLIVGVLAAVICLVFVGLQSSRMHLSRNGLTVLVASLEALITKQKAALKADDALIAQLQQQLSQLARVTELITINTPLPTEYAFAMAACTSHSTFVSMLSTSTARSSMLETAGMRADSAAAAVKQAMEAESRAERPSMSRSIRAASIRSTVHPSRKSDLAADCASQSGRVRSVVEPVAQAARKPGRLSSHPSPDNGVADGYRTVSVSSSGQSESAAAMRDVQSDCPGGEQGTSRGQRLRTSTEAAAWSVLTSPQAASSAPFSPAAAAAARPSPPEAVLRHLSSAGFADQTSAVGATSWKSFEARLTICLEQQHTHRMKQAQASALAGRTSKSGADELESETAAFQLASPLLGGELQVVGESLSALALPVLLSHPVCVEAVKAALQEVHSVENLIFYLHVQRYRRMQSARLRRALACCIHQHFIRADAPQQINLSTRMRDAISEAVGHKGGEACGAELFREAEREVVTLMSNNVLRSLPECRLRLCAWILAVVPLAALTETGLLLEAADVRLTSSQQADLVSAPQPPEAQSMLVSSQEDSAASSSHHTDTAGMQDVH